jgi:hypothetical protein
MYLTQEDEAMMEGSFRIFSKLYQQTGDMTVKEASVNLKDLPPAMRKRYTRKDTKDTMGFDILAENIIGTGDQCGMGHSGLFQSVYGKSGVMITEECGRMPRDVVIGHDTPVVISDPVDASSLMEYLMEKYSPEADHSRDKLSDVFRRHMEESGPTPIRRHACNASVTLLRDSMIIYSIVMNLFTGDIYVASRKGVFRGDARSAAKLVDISTPIEFIGGFDDYRGLNMICYNRGEKYNQNLRGTHLKMFRPADMSELVEKTGPVGPMRFTNLVKFEDAPDPEIGIVAHNGEKVQELLPNVAIAFYSKGALNACKLFCDMENAQDRAGRLLTPNLANSFYSGMIAAKGIKSGFLDRHDYPSEFRDTTAIYHSGNDAANTMFHGMIKKEYAIRIV